MIPNTTYHIYNHANGFENLFREVENYRYFLRQWQKYISPVAETFAYCLMPNHIHFLVSIKDEDVIASTFGKFETFQKLESRISKQFANLFSSYTQAFNKRYGRKGSLFMPNFKREEISSDSYYSSIVCYIHLNPVKHGFCAFPRDWSFSSFGDYLHDRSTFVNKNEVLEWFGNREQFLLMHEEARLDIKDLES